MDLRQGSIAEPSSSILPNLGVSEHISDINELDEIVA